MKLPGKAILVLFLALFAGCATSPFAYRIDDLSPNPSNNSILVGYLIPFNSKGERRKLNSPWSIFGFGTDVNITAQVNDRIVKGAFTKDGLIAIRLPDTAEIEKLEISIHFSQGDDRYYYQYTIIKSSDKPIRMETGKAYLMPVFLASVPGFGSSIEHRVQVDVKDLYKKEMLDKYRKLLPEENAKFETLEWKRN